MDVDTKQFFLKELGFMEGKLLVKYLGVPLISSKLSKEDCAPIVDKVKRKLTSWSTKKLSYAGRIQLINSVVFHYLVYWSNIFMLPKAIIKHIDSLCRKFLWSGQIEQKTMVLVSWDAVCTPKSEGGLSVKQLGSWNKAAYGKILWKILANPNCLWTKWVRAVYLKGECLWNVKSRSDDSWS